MILVAIITVAVVVLVVVVLNSIPVMISNKKNGNSGMAAILSLVVNAGGKIYWPSK